MTDFLEYILIIDGAIVDYATVSRTHEYPAAEARRILRFNHPDNGTIYVKLGKQ